MIDVKVPVASTPDKDRVCMAVEGRAYCGRSLRPDRAVSEWDLVVCADCWAAYRADEAAGVVA